MSKKYELVKRYYDHKLWTAEQVQAAVKYGWITEEECEQILGIEDTAA